MERSVSGTYAPGGARGYQALEKSTQRIYNDVLRIAQCEDALGGLSVTVIRPALVQAFLDGLAKTPGR